MLKSKWLHHTASAIALLALTLTGCNSGLRGDGAEPDEGAERTSLMVTLSTEVGLPRSLRGITDAQDTEVPGAKGTGEDKVEHLTLAMRPGILLSSDDPKAVTQSSRVYTVLFKDIPYPGPEKLSCSVYLGQKLPGLSHLDFYPDRAVSHTQLRTLTNDDEGFVMTSEAGRETITLQPGITEPSRGSSNYLSYQVERVVSKGAVSYDMDGIDVSKYSARFAPTTPGVPSAQGVSSEGFSSSGAILPVGWAAVGGAKSAYLFRNHAGRRTMGNSGDADCGLYTGLTTLSAVGKSVGEYDLFKLSDYMSMTGDADIDKAKAKPFLFFTEFTGTIDTGKLDKGYNGPGDTSNNNNGVSLKGGAYPASPYFLEHALRETKKERTAYDIQVTYRDVAYAKVLTQTKAVRGAMIDQSVGDLPFYYRVSTGDPLAGQTTTEGEGYTEVTLGIPYADLSGLRVVPTAPNDGTSSQFYSRRYLVEVTEAWYNDNKGKKYPASTGTLHLGKPSESTLYPGLRGDEAFRFVKIKFKNGDVHWFFEVRDRVLDYYVGAGDGNVYNSLLAARAAGNTKSRKYTLGQAYYLVPFNAQKDATGKIYNCDTRRNNIYDLRITAIVGMGYNYDPVDPQDPYMPMPEDNPDEPETTVPSINKDPQMIRIKARILDWDYIHYTADLMDMLVETN